MGTNVLIVTPRRNQRRLLDAHAAGGAVTTLVEREHLAIHKDSHREHDGPAVVTDSFRIKAGDLSKVTTVLGCEPDYFAMKEFSPAQRARLR